MKSPCPDKEVCGSCGWSHIPYDKQLKQKLSDINGSFKIKNLKVETSATTPNPSLEKEGEPLECKEILPAVKTEHYRDRMDFVIDFEGRVGLREKGKWWRVIDDHTCFISDEKIEAHFKQVRDWTKTADLSFFDRKAHTGLLRYAVIRSSSIGQTMISIVTGAPSDEIERDRIRLAMKELSKIANPTTLIWSINNTPSDVSFGDELQTISGPGFIEEEFETIKPPSAFAKASADRLTPPSKGGEPHNATPLLTKEGLGEVSKTYKIKYQISPNAFFQTNLYTAPELLKTVQEFAGDVSNKTVLDLYCGTGFFSIAFAKNAKKTFGVELVPEAIADAKRNAEINNVEVEYYDAKTEEFDWKSLNADIVILDPPRSGMHDKALQDVIEAQPQEIIYVSCNYKNFARELVKLQKYYKVTHMRAIDMFPHTPHVELITRLELR